MIAVRCPICNEPMPGPVAEWPQSPFCSDRCRLIDLGRWLGEGYRIPATTEGETPADSAPEDEEAP